MYSGAGTWEKCRSSLPELVPTRRKKGPSNDWRMLSISKLQNNRERIEAHQQLRVDYRLYFIIVIPSLRLSHSLCALRSLRTETSLSETSSALALLCILVPLFSRLNHNYCCTTRAHWLLSSLLYVSRDIYIPVSPYSFTIGLFSRSKGPWSYSETGWAPNFPGTKCVHFYLFIKILNFTRYIFFLLYVRSSARWHAYREKNGSRIAKVPRYKLYLYTLLALNRLYFFIRSATDTFNCSKNSSISLLTYE